MATDEHRSTQIKQNLIYGEQVWKEQIQLEEYRKQEKEKPKETLKWLEKDCLFPTVIGLIIIEYNNIIRICLEEEPFDRFVHDPDTGQEK